MSEAVEASVGLGPELLGIATSARQDLELGARAWVSTAPRPWAISGELVTAHRLNAHDGLYTYDTWYTAAAALFDLGLGTHATVARVGAGPALAVRIVHFTGDAVDVSTVLPEPGQIGRAHV